MSGTKASLLEPITAATAEHGEVTAWRCKNCSAAYLDQGRALEHLSNTSCGYGGQHQCPQCGYKALNRRDLRRHHRSEARCRRRSATADETLIHMDDESGLYRCRVCGRTYASSTLSLTHASYSSCRKIDRYKCETCGFKTNNPSMLKTHLQRENGNGCRMFLRKAELQMEIKAAMETRFGKETADAASPQECPHCHYRTGIAKHMLAHLKNEECQENSTEEAQPPQKKKRGRPPGSIFRPRRVARSPDKDNWESSEETAHSETISQYAEETSILDKYILPLSEAPQSELWSSSLGDETEITGNPNADEPLSAKKTAQADTNDPIDTTIQVTEEGTNNDNTDRSMTYYEPRKQKSNNCKGMSTTSDHDLESVTDQNTASETSESSILGTSEPLHRKIEPTSSTSIADTNSDAEENFETKPLITNALLREHEHSFGLNSGRKETADSNILESDPEGDDVMSDAEIINTENQSPKTRSKFEDNSKMNIEVFSDEEYSLSEENYPTQKESAMGGKARQTRVQRSTIPIKSPITTHRNTIKESQLNTFKKTPLQSERYERKTTPMTRQVKSSASYRTAPVGHFAMSDHSKPTSTSKQVAQSSGPSLECRSCGQRQVTLPALYAHVRSTPGCQNLRLLLEIQQRMQAGVSKG